MITKIRTAPPHSLFFISGGLDAPAPEITRTPGIWQNSHCAVVGCLSPQDGETDLLLLWDGEKMPPEPPDFDGLIETPKRIVIVSTSERHLLGEARVASVVSRIRIWVNHPVEPDRIVVAFG